MGQRLGNEEVIITDRNRKILILVDHEHAQPGEMECIPHPDQFPLLIVHKARAAVVKLVGKDAPLESSIPAAALPPAGVAQNAARSSAGSSNDHLQAGRAPALAGAAAGSVFAAAPLVSAAEIARVSSWRRCERCGWTRLPEHITCACVVCCRSVVCHGCGPHWRGVCYTCVDKLANGQTVHYTC